MQLIGNPYNAPVEVEAEAKFGWHLMPDEASGASYYYNYTTGESSWTNPEEVGEQGGVGLEEQLGVQLGEHQKQEQELEIAENAHLWQEIDDPEGKYYYNTVSGETSWTNPEELEEQGGVGLEEQLGVQLGEQQKQEQELEIAENAHLWQEIDDPEGKYYYNTVSGETSWTNPEDVGGQGRLEEVGEQLGKQQEPEQKPEPEQEQEQEIAEPAQPWQEIDDPGGEYYYNTVSGESTYTRPPEFNY
ncbi:hypothetical protein ScalyP_jg6390 [Parmales sp. scaly parma]|nr:hypothetical protein ScalyP_jg6390 [Parmales sp. scaly parma]